MKTRYVTRCVWCKKTKQNDFPKGTIVYKRALCKLCLEEYVAHHFPEEKEKLERNENGKTQ